MPNLHNKVCVKKYGKERMETNSFTHKMITREENATQQPPSLPH